MPTLKIPKATSALLIWYPRKKASAVGNKKEQGKEKTKGKGGKELAPCEKPATFVSSTTVASPKEVEPPGHPETTETGSQSDWSASESKVEEETKESETSSPQRKSSHGLDISSDGTLDTSTSDSRVHKCDSPTCQTCSQSRTHMTHFVPVDLASLPRHMKPGYRPTPPLAQAATAPEEFFLASSFQSLTIHPWDMLVHAHRELLQNELCSAVCHTASENYEMESLAADGEYRVVLSVGPDHSLVYSDAESLKSSWMHGADLSWREVITLNSSEAESTLFDGLQDEETAEDDSSSTDDDYTYDFY